MLGSVQNFYGANVRNYQQVYTTPVNRTLPATNTFDSSNLSGVQADTFQSSITKEEIAQKKFKALFPNGEIDKLYNEINKDFQIENPAKLNFVYDEQSIRGGGYTFSTNEIEMNLYDLLSSNKKIVGIKNGKKYPLASPTSKIPLFADEKLANEFVAAQSQAGNFGFDQLVIEDVTPQEHRKFIMQKIAHECVHAKQHELLRHTEGVGDKEILKAWTHKQPKNLIESAVLDYKCEQEYKKTPWASTTKPDVKYKKGSAEYQKAMILLDAIRNYPAVDSPEYNKNALEREAFDVSYQYICTKKF